MIFGWIDGAPCLKKKKKTQNLIGNVFCFFKKNLKIGLGIFGEKIIFKTCFKNRVLFKNIF